MFQKENKFIIDLSKMYFNFLPQWTNPSTAPWKTSAPTVPSRGWTTTPVWVEAASPPCPSPDSPLPPTLPPLRQATSWSLGAPQLPPPRQPHGTTGWSPWSLGARAPATCLKTWWRTRTMRWAAASAVASTTGCPRSLVASGTWWELPARTTICR